MGEFVKVIKLKELNNKKSKSVEIRDKTLAVFNIKGTYRVIDDLCTHADASLADGELVDDCTVECPLHGARFCLKDGEALTPPAIDPIKVYKTRIVGDHLEVELE